MAGTRHSLPASSASAHAFPSSSPAPDSSGMSKKQIAALKKLQIDGSDALKGDSAALEKAKRDREMKQVYHFRGAVYEIDPSLTREEWIAQQPRRWRKKMGLLSDEEQRDEESRAKRKAEDDDEQRYVARGTKRRTGSDEESEQGEAGGQGEDSDVDTQTADSPPKKRRRVTEPVERPHHRMHGARGGRKQPKRASMPTAQRPELNEEEKAEKRRRQTENARLARSQQAALRRASRDAAQEEEERVEARKAKKREENAKSTAVPYWPPSQRAVKRQKRGTQPRTSAVRAAQREASAQEVDGESTRDRESAQRRGLQVEALEEHDLARNLSANVKRIAKLNAVISILNRKNETAISKCNNLRYQRLAISRAAGLPEVVQSNGVEKSVWGSSRIAFVYNVHEDPEIDDTFATDSTDMCDEGSSQAGMTQKVPGPKTGALSKFTSTASERQDVVMQEPTPEASRRSSAGSVDTPPTNGPTRHDSLNHISPPHIRPRKRPELYNDDLIASAGADRGHTSQIATTPSLHSPPRSSIPPPSNATGPLPYTAMHGAGSFTAAELHLPQTNKGGDPLLWTLQGAFTDDGNAKFWINKARQEGETDVARRRRVKRELKEMEKWQTRAADHEMGAPRATLGAAAGSGAV